MAFTIRENHLLVLSFGKLTDESAVFPEKSTTPDNPTNPTTPATETPQKETPTTPKTGDDRNPLIWLLLLDIGGCMAGTALMVEKEQKVIEKIVS